MIFAITFDFSATKKKTFFFFFFIPFVTECETHTHSSIETTSAVPATTIPTASQSDVDEINVFTSNAIDDRSNEIETTVSTIINETEQNHSKRRKREILISADHLTNNNEYTMEVLVAVDRRMQEYHGHNIKPYVLTLMSMVSSIYADASIGNSINVAVVHILLLNDDLHVEQSPNGTSF